MFRSLSRNEHLVPLLLRIPVALVFLFSGYPKLMNLAGTAVLFGKFGLPGWVGQFAAFLEVFGGIAILLGVGTRLFGLLFVIEMIVAIYAVNWGQAVAKGFDYNAIRLQVMTAFTCLALVLSGGGAFSVDKLLFGGKRKVIGNET